ncbi:MAG: PilZ domain-containing protein [Polyangiaceae bacterium]|jgi:PilZ domain
MPLPVPSPQAPPASPSLGSAGPHALVASLRGPPPLLTYVACGVRPNRRAEIRRALRFGCRVRRSDGQRLVGDRAVDLSPRGMLLLSDERLERETVLVVSFMATEFPIWFDTRAIVARVVEGRRTGDPGRAVGLRFESLPSVSQLILRGHLKKLDPTTPQRERPGSRVIHRLDPDYARIVKDILDGN